MKVAFATDSLLRVDAHFGWARNIAIYELSVDGYWLREVVQFDGDLEEDGGEGKLIAKLEAVRDCAVLYVAAIGGSAAAAAGHRGHPRTHAGGDEWDSAAVVAQSDAERQGAHRDRI